MANLPKRFHKAVGGCFASLKHIYKLKDEREKDIQHDELECALNKIPNQEASPQVDTAQVL